MYNGDSTFCCKNGGGAAGIFDFCAELVGVQPIFSIFTTESCNCSWDPSLSRKRRHFTAKS